MRGHAFLALLALVLLACESPPPSADPTPGPSPASSSDVTSDPWPSAPAYSLSADVALRRALAERQNSGPLQTTVQDGVFVLASKDWALAAVDKRMHDALAAMLHGRFSRLPARAVTVYAFDQGPDFESLCAVRLGRACDGVLGFWLKETREIMVNLQPGDGTLVHELAHVLLAADAEAVPGGPPAWTAPRWLREGIAALYEQPVLEGTEIHGATNWRLDDLRRAQGSPTDAELVHLDALLRMPDDLFDGDHALAAYAVARFACQWMDSPEEDRLWKFYRGWRARGAADPTGEATFKEVFEQEPHAADAAFQKWMRSLHK